MKSSTTAMFRKSGRISCWLMLSVCGPPMPACMLCATNQARIEAYIQPKTTAKKPTTT